MLHNKLVLPLSWKIYLSGHINTLIGKIHGKKFFCLINLSLVVNVKLIYFSCYSFENTWRKNIAIGCTLIPIPDPTDPDSSSRNTIWIIIIFILIRQKGKIKCELLKSFYQNISTQMVLTSAFADLQPSISICLSSLATTSNWIDGCSETALYKVSYHYVRDLVS